MTLEMSVNSCKIFQRFSLFIFLILIIYTTYTQAYLKILSPSLTSPVTEADVGSRLVLYCNISSHKDPHILWLKDGHMLTSDLSWKRNEVQGSIVSSALLTSDAGNYSCQDNHIVGAPELHTQLVIKTPPSKLINVTVHPSTVVATVRWHVDYDGGYPITYFTLVYLPLEANESEAWNISQPVHISPSFRQFFIYHLRPGTNYVFRLWANNKLGSGEPSTIHASTAKPFTNPEVLQHMMANTETFSSEAWVVAISMVLITVLILSFLSCFLIYKEGRHEAANQRDASPRIISNPGFDIDLEECYLLDHADCNDNTERAVRTNNNTVIQPSRV